MTTLTNAQLINLKIENIKTLASNKGLFFNTAKTNKSNGLAIHRVYISTELISRSNNKSVVWLNECKNSEYITPIYLLDNAMSYLENIK